MRRVFPRILLGLAVLLGAPSGGAADEQAAWAALREGGQVALVRHADAPGGAGDPSGFRLDDCTTQRNLSEEGRADAKAVGEAFKSAGVAVGRILSSPWCRCVDTARLLALGPVEIEPTFSNAFVLADRRDVLTAGARAVIGGWRGPGTLLVVTHGANIQALTGYNPSAGEVVVVTARNGDALQPIGRIPVPRR